MNMFYIFMAQCHPLIRLGLSVVVCGMVHSVLFGFELTDSSPDPERFKQQFLGSFGVLEAVEPQISRTDREIYDRIFPLLAEHPEEAKALAEAALTEDSGAALYYLAGNLSYQCGDLAKAGEYLEKAVDKFPSFSRAFRTLALLALRQEKFADSRALFLKVISLGGGDAQSYGLLGYAYLQEKQFLSAQKAYEMALMYQPSSQDFRRGMVHCLIHMQSYSQAIALLDELIREYPQTTDYLLLQANAYLSQGNQREALVNLVLAHERDKTAFEGHALMGDIFLHEGLVHLAAESYLESLKAKSLPPFNKALLPLKYLLERHHSNEAQQYLMRLKTTYTELSPMESNEMNKAQAMLDYQNGHYEAGASALDSILSAFPLDGEALLLRGDIEESLGNPEEAAFYVQRAVSIPDFQVRAYIRLGQLKVRQGKSTEALSFLEKAQRLLYQPHVDKFIVAIRQSMSSTE